MKCALDLLRSDSRVFFSTRAGLRTVIGKVSCLPVSSMRAILSWIMGSAKPSCLKIANIALRIIVSMNSSGPLSFSRFGYPTTVNSLKRVNSSIY